MRIDKSSDNLYTPDWLIDLIVEFYSGQIDLDPSADPQKRIPALNHYTFEDDGLTKKWLGNVFCNPPYSKNNGTSIADWVSKAYESVERDRAQQTNILLLLPANTDTAWGQRLLRDAIGGTSTKILFFNGRIKFLGSDYKPTRSTGLFASMLAYIGVARRDFNLHFEKTGVVV